jgi:hypothetical protein
VQEYQAYSELSQLSQTGCIGVKNVKLFLREPLVFSHALLAFVPAYTIPVGTKTGLAESSISVKIFSLKWHLGYNRKFNKIKDIHTILIPAVFTI